MKLGHALATASWISTFVLIWLMIAEVVEPHPATAFLVFFFCLAVIVSAMLSPRKADKKEKGSNGRDRPN